MWTPQKASTQTSSCFKRSLRLKQLILMWPTAIQRSHLLVNCRQRGGNVSGLLAVRFPGQLECEHSRGALQEMVDRIWHATTAHVLIAALAVLGFKLAEQAAGAAAGGGFEHVAQPGGLQAGLGG